jgi:hypothetical protein
MINESDKLSAATLAVKRAAWRTRAAAQGLVCLVCGEIPALERRAAFYDTGLCGACAHEIHLEPMKGVG